MATRVFAFEPPRWRPVSRLVTFTLAVLAAAGGWLLLYAWLGYRLWVEGLPVLTPGHLVLGAVLVTGGVILLLLLWELVRRWVRLWRPAAWRALNVEQMMALTPSEFEEYVARRLFERQGYQVVNTRDVKDGGVDLILTDRRGRRAVVQCKRYRGTVGAEIVRDLYGTMIHDGAAQGFLVATGPISAEARRWAAGKPITLIDGPRLVELARSLPREGA
jgi:restriction system protein